jgi:Tol biopolymer transport system component
MMKRCRRLLLMSALLAGAGLAYSGELTLPAAREVAFEVGEGTWMSLDVAPDGSQIVFDLLGDLYLLPVTGGEAERLTEGMAFDSQPRFSPDGQQLVFISDRDGQENLWLLDLVKGESRKLTSAASLQQFASPSFSPDGTHVIVSRTDWRLGSYELWAYHLAGGKGVQITRANGDGNTPQAQRPNSLGAVYSGDGRYLYFARKLGGFAYNLRFPQWQIVRRDLRTGDEDFLTQAQGSAFRPLLSPDGKTLIYGTRHEQQTGLRSRDLDSGEDRWLVYPVTRDEQESRYTRDLLPGYQFTPDGSALIYSAGGGIERYDLGTGTRSRIPFSVAVNQALGERLYFPYRIGLGPVRARQLMGPELSPDGARLAFSAFMQVHVFDLTTRTIQVITPAEESKPGSKAFHPVWSPDGREIAYVSWSSQGGGHVWRVRADGRGQPRQVSRQPGYYSDPVWSPDGERIVALRAASYDRLYREFDFGSPIGSDLIWLPRAGGPANLIAPSRGFQQPHFGAEAQRIFLYQPQNGGGLTSLRFDGSDRRAHLVIKGPGTLMQDESVAAAEVRLAPDGLHALALHANQLYLVRLLNRHLGGLEVSLSATDEANLPVARLTDVGADFFGWSPDGEQIFWTAGNELYLRPLDSVVFPEPDSTESADGDVEEQGDPAGGDAIAEAHESVQRLTVDVYRPRARPEGTLALTGGTVLSMVAGQSSLPEHTVLIEKDRILAVGRADEVEIPDGARVVDVSGRYLLPGLVDTHAHFRPLRRILDDDNWAFLANLAYGVTTGLDVQPSTTDILAYEDLIDAGLMTGPRALSTGPGVFSNNVFRSADHAEAVLRRYRDHYGVRNVKAYLVGDRRQRQYLVEAARRLRLMPTTEGALDMQLDLTHVIDGFSGNEHNFPVTPLYDDVVTLVARSGIGYTPTLLITYGGPWAEGYFYSRESPHRSTKLRRFMPANVIAARTQRRRWVMDEEFTFPAVASAAAAIARAGGRVGIGSHGQLQGLGYHWEMWAMAMGGMTFEEVLTAATRQGAEMIGVAEDLGTIAPGKLADLIVLDEDPLADIRNTTTLRYVIRNGELYDAGTLDKLWPEHVPLPAQWWWESDPLSGQRLP